uniref:Uncharacterized protein n=1 Tax=Solanum lycopersicum TaxID=4081 RepID=A0A3Q7HP87_SOLLC
MRFFWVDFSFLGTSRYRLRGPLHVAPLTRKKDEDGRGNTFINLDDLEIDLGFKKK